MQVADRSIECCVCDFGVRGCQQKLQILHRSATGTRYSATKSKLAGINAETCLLFGWYLTVVMANDQ